jgi:hypothetical protein
MCAHLRLLNHIALKHSPRWKAEREKAKASPCTDIEMPVAFHPLGPQKIADATVRLTAVPPPKGEQSRWGSQRLEIFLRQRHGDAFASWPGPSVTFNAADEPLAEPVDLDQRTVAAGAGF